MERYMVLVYALGGGALNCFLYVFMEVEVFHGVTSQNILPPPLVINDCSLTLTKIQYVYSVLPPSICHFSKNRFISRILAENLALPNNKTPLLQVFLSLTFYILLIIFSCCYFGMPGSTFILYTFWIYPLFPHWRSTQFSLTFTSGQAVIIILSHLAPHLSPQYSPSLSHILTQVILL